jgi:hypothetical protein
MESLSSSSSAAAAVSVLTITKFVEDQKHLPCHNVTVKLQYVLGTFAKLLKATLSFLMSVSVRPSDLMEHLAPPGRIFMKLEYFSKICRES